MVFTMRLKCQARDMNAFERKYNTAQRPERTPVSCVGAVSHPHLLFQREALTPAIATKFEYR